MQHIANLDVQLIGHPSVDGGLIILQPKIVRAGNTGGYDVVERRNRRVVGRDLIQQQRVNLQSARCDGVYELGNRRGNIDSARVQNRQIAGV